MSYRWNHPSEWLGEKIDNLDTHPLKDHTLRSIARELLAMVDGDQIQDVFQAEMDADGYFDDRDSADQVAAIADAETLDDLLAAINRDPDTWYDHNGDDYSDIPKWGPRTTAVNDLIHSSGPHGDLVSWDTRSDDVTEHRYLRRTWHPALPPGEQQSFAIYAHDEVG